MQATAILESIFRWIHVVAGILWIGLLYFFNWVNSAFVPTMDGDTKKKVIPELLPRALYWFRWGAAWTWITGVLLVMLVFYQGGVLFDQPSGWGLAAIVMVAITFLGVFLYDAIMKSLGKTNLMAAIGVCFVLVVAAIYLMGHWAHFGYRGYVIHTGAMFGTTMAFNVWFRIWPSQRQIITAIKNGQAPDPAVVALAGMRSRQNVYMSIPLVWAMIDQHTSWAARSWLILPAVILLGWWIGTMLFKRAPKVKGF